MKAFKLGPWVSCRVSFHSMTLDPRVHALGWGLRSKSSYCLDTTRYYTLNPTLPNATLNPTSIPYPTLSPSLPYPTIPFPTLPYPMPYTYVLYPTQPSPPILWLTLPYPTINTTLYPTLYLLPYPSLLYPTIPYTLPLTLPYLFLS